MQVSQAVTVDYPDLNLQTGLEVIAGLLYVPLSIAGGDFIAFLRKGQPTHIHWAGRPHKEDEVRNRLEPRHSFRAWGETVAGRCRAWTDEQLETAGVLALVYGKVKSSEIAVLDQSFTIAYFSSSKCGGRRNRLCRPRS